MRALFWGYLTIFVFFLALIFSRVVYHLIEKLMFAAALATFLGLVGACCHPSVREKIPEFLTGLIPFTKPLAQEWQKADATKLLTAITFAGLGGFWSLFYSYWIREKNAGMAAHIGRIKGALGNPEPIPESGFLPEQTPENAASYLPWRRFLFWDAGAGIIGNIITTLMTCLLAYAVLHPQGLLPQGWDIATVQARFFETSWGTLGKSFFLVIAAAFLADTWLSTCDAVARVNTDIIYCLSEKAHQWSIRWWYYFFVCVLTLITGLTMPLAQPGRLILLSSVIGFAGTVLFSGALLVLNHRWLPRHLPEFARPKKISFYTLSFCCFAYIILLIAYCWAKISS